MFLGTPPVATAEPFELTPGVAHRIEGAPPGRNDLFLHRATAGEAFLVTVEQSGLDFTLDVLAPDGRLRSFNSPLERDGSEVVLIEFAQEGAYRLAVESADLTDATGDYLIDVTRFDSQALGNQHYLEALRRFTAGAEAYGSGDAELMAGARTAYLESVALWEATDRTEMLAQARYSVAYLDYWFHNEFSESAAYAESAAQAYLQEPGHQRLSANATLLAAAALLEESQIEPAIMMISGARDELLSLDAGYDVAQADEKLAYARHLQGDLDAAYRLRKQAADRFEALGEWYKALTPRVRATVVEMDRGYIGAALEVLEPMVERLPPSTDPWFRAEILDALGDGYRLAGRVDKALATYQASLELHRNNQDAYGEAVALRGLGKTYVISGELDPATVFLEQAVARSRNVNRQILEQSLTELGNVAYLSGDYERSLTVHQSALDELQAASRESADGSPGMSPVDLSNRRMLIARDLNALGRHGEARAEIERAIGLLGSVDVPYHIAEARLELGKTDLYEGKADLAIGALDQSLAIFRSIGSEEGQAATLHALARAQRQQGHFETAARYGEEAIVHAESTRANMVNPELRAMYSQSRRDYYESQLDLLVAMARSDGPAAAAHLDQALEVSERYRARMMMDLLAEASVDMRRGIDPALRAEQVRIRDELNARLNQRAAQGVVAGDLLVEIADYEHQLTLLENRIRETNALYRSLTMPATLDRPGMQAALDPDSVLLQYALGEERSFVFAVTQDSLAVVELPARAGIDAAARRLAEVLRRYPSKPVDLSRAREELARLVLAPVQGHLDRSRVIIAADGALHYVPFQVLSLDGPGGQTSLVERFEVVGVPSMSVLSAIRQHAGAKTERKTVAVFADPVFSPEDPRLAAPPPAMAATVATGLARLAYSEAEARSIEALVPPGQRLVARGFAANRELALDGALGQYRYLHFATHGEVNTRIPRLSRLYLSNFDELGRPRDGLVLLDDIYNLVLNADLVVLSACDTALGEEIRGEGLVGFAQGFFSAGAKSLVVSLWQVPDRATAELMKRFYAGLLDQEAALTPAESLRQAQRSMAAEPRWRDPYLWGAFVVLGDWR